MSESVVTGIGALAAVFTSLSFIPQVFKMWRSQSVADVSPVTFIQFSCGAILWIVYGIYREDAVVIGANLVTLATLLAALALYFRHKLTPIQQYVLAAICGARTVGADAAIAVRQSTHGLMKAVDGAGIDLGVVAKEAVQGAILGAKAAGIQQDSTAEAASAGALDAAEAISAQAAKRVKEAMSETDVSR